MSEDKIEATNSSEQIQDIIQKIPQGLTSILIGLIAVLLIALLVIGWMVRWPEIVSGEIEITSQNQPVNLVAKTNGRITLLLKKKEKVSRNQYIGYIKNPAKFEDVVKLKSKLKGFDQNNIKSLAGYLPNRANDLELGEIQNSYFDLQASASELSNFRTKNEFDIQLKSISSLKEFTIKALNQKKIIKDIRHRKLQLAQKEYERDSVLYGKKAVIEIDFEKTKGSLLNAKELYQITISEIYDLYSKAEEISVDYLKISNEKAIKEDHLINLVYESYKDLMVQIQMWDEKYAFTSPIDGQLEYLQFLNEDQFISAGEILFSVVSQQALYHGQLFIPTVGAGKVEIGQLVHVKLENYPFKEYGIITAKIESISLVPNQGTYLLTLNIGDRLVTNRDIPISFQYGMKGYAEIITSDKTLLARIFESIEESLNQAPPAPSEKKNDEKGNKRN